MPCSPVPYPVAAGIEAPAVVVHARTQLAVRRVQATTSTEVRLRVLRGVLQRLEHREVHGRLDVLRVGGRRRRRRPSRASCDGGPGPRARPPSPCRRAAAGRCRGRGRAGRRAPSPCRPGGRRASPWPSPGRDRRAVRRGVGAPASATSCCWAPSWMFRSSLRRSSSCAVDEALLRRLQVGQARLGAAGSGARSAARAPPAPRGPARAVPVVGSIGSLAGIDDGERPEQLALVPDLGREVVVGCRARRAATSRPSRISSPTSESAPRRARRRRPRPARAPSAAARRRRSRCRRADRRTSPSPRTGVARLP